MRGFIKVYFHLYFQPKSFERHCNSFEHDPTYTETVENMYIRKADVLQVVKITCFEQFQEWVDRNDVSDRSGSNSYAAIQLTDVDCHCGAMDVWSKLERGDALENKTRCSCITEDTFPLYIIKCKNKIERSHFEDAEDVLAFVPKVATYIVDQSERENMERFLAGTDDPLYDYVHLLRYGPDGGTYVAKAKEEFESAVKRQKSTNSTNA